MLRAEKDCDEERMGRGTRIFTGEAGGGGKRPQDYGPQDYGDPALRRGETGVTPATPLHYL
jgi:hypothetical protein